MRGHHRARSRSRHDLRDGKTFPLDGLPIEERYDLVVVGGGISGLAAAWFYRRAFGRKARILMLDNHDDFGGHAKRNEFRARTAASSSAMAAASRCSRRKALYSPLAKQLIKELGVDVDALRERVRARPLSVARICRAACSSRARVSAATCW